MTTDNLSVEDSDDADYDDADYDEDQYYAWDAEMTSIAKEKSRRWRKGLKEGYDQISYDTSQDKDDEVYVLTKIQYILLHSCISLHHEITKSEMGIHVVVHLTYLTDSSNESEGECEDDPSHPESSLTLGASGG